MSLERRWSAAIEAALGRAPGRATPLSGGCVGEVYRLEVPGRGPLVAKVDAGGRLEPEAYMLRTLGAQGRVPVPVVVHAEPTLLVMTWLPGDSRFGPGAERHAAELLAGLHAVTAPTFGLERDTVIGGLPQPNPPAPAWIPFFRDHRLLYMAREAASAGRLPPGVLARIERLAARLEDLLEEPDAPSLIHGDVWTTNVLAEGDRITGFLDPAIYFAHPEVELAFITLFGTFGEPFFRRYGELRPIRPGFFEERRDLYNLYPLLVHVRLFGGGYVQSVDRTLRRFAGGG